MTPNATLVRNSRENLSINLEFEITRSTTRGRNTNDIVFVDTASQQSIRPNTFDSPTWLIQTLEYELV
jgi:hypothetical protein